MRCPLYAVLIALALSALAVAGESSVTGANVPEERATSVVYVSVDHPDASDENLGTEAHPLRSISRAASIAMANNSKGTGTRVLIAPGIYRDQVKLPYRGEEQTDAPMIFEAITKGAAILSGSDVFSDWHKVEGRENIYWHHWPYKWGPREQVKDPVWIRCGIFYRPILLRRETVYANGQLLKLVLSPLGLREGTMYVTQEEERLIVWLPRGLDARSALMEVPVRAGLFFGQGQRNVVLRGLVVKHDNSYYGMSSACAFYSGSRNILIEDCRFEWNNCGGYGVNTVRDLTVRRVVSNYNGGSGATGCRLENVFYEDTENSYNNWRGDWGEYYSWSVGGTKFLQVRNALWLRNRSIGNHALGFWFDCSCTHIVMDGCFWARNTRNALFLEANQGPIAIRNSVIAFNAGGIMSTNSSNITLENNILYGNGSAQISVQGPRDRTVPCWNWGGKTKRVVVQIDKWAVRNNIAVATGRRQLCFNVAYADPQLFMRTLRSQSNLWFSAGRPNVFSVAGVQMALDEWRSVSGQDLASRFADPKFVRPQELNFWFAGDSPVLAARSVTTEGAFDEAKSKAILDGKQEDLIDQNWRQPFPAAAQTKSEQWQPLDLRPHANRPLRGEDGWMGVGGLTLDWLNGGPHTIQGVPFEILDPTDGKLACIALRSFRVQTTGDKELPSKVPVPVGRRLEALYILHGCGWAKRAKVAQYRMIYDDGTKSAIDIIPYASGSEHLDVMERLRKESTIQDWWPSLPQIENDHLRHVIVANPNNPAGKRYLYHLRWANPSPRKRIQHVELESDPKTNTSIFVVAITAALP